MRNLLITCPPHLWLVYLLAHVVIPRVIHHILVGLVFDRLQSCLPPLKKFTHLTVNVLRLLVVLQLVTVVLTVYTKTVNQPVDVCRLRFKQL